MNLESKKKSIEKVKIIDSFARKVFMFSGIFVILILVLIMLFLLKEAIPFFKDHGILEFFFGTQWDPTSAVEEKYGIIPLFISTLFITIGSLIISIPVGLGAAIFFAEYSKGKTSEFIRYIMEVLSSIPSVVIGFIGITLIGPFLAEITGSNNGFNAVNGSILVALMTLPTIISISTDALKDVPKDIKDASLSLGSTKWEAIIKVAIPQAKRGILASFMLGVGRAVGETMTVVMATGNAPALPKSFLDSVRTMTANIAIEMGEVPIGSKHYHSLFAIGLILFLITLVINLISQKITKRIS
ncbi:MAG TPA: phosphate ABC transporter permease subunit PstC [Spirochaetota bacterium]|nr:phosphate ABC transporter permease subunit PstC [Spirochaetota bacterium]HOM37846.1 phosphate ABC transporter permease subunit PstC [Spirochaetota bacterium]HPQ49277.1 phosphate ABC transporter permease subunit PstC [Spirochaetota bacterium]